MRPEAIEGKRDSTRAIMFWLPLGAGGRFVRTNGRAYEALVAAHEHRAPRALYHSALEVFLGGERYTIEMTPVWSDQSPDRGVVRIGPVGARWLGRSRLFRYEVRRWRDGVIPDLAEAVGAPIEISHDPALIRRLLDLVPQVPALTWGRDESQVGEMWNSNSLTAWLLARAGHDVHDITPPGGGRAPGWNAGLLVARQQLSAGGRLAGGRLEQRCPRVLTEQDLDPLPAPVARYIRQAGAVGKPPVGSIRAVFHGRIRAGADKRWMAFTGEQVNTFGRSPERFFRMHATMAHLPVDVLHVFTGDSATMRVKLCSLLPVANASGPVMDRSETVTVLNDLCVLAPAALADARIAWTELDDRRARATFTRGAHTVTADLLFDDRDHLVDFTSEDRSRASSNGKTFRAQRWSTPVGGYRSFHGRMTAASGQARWTGPEPEGTWTYLEFELDDIVSTTSTVDDRLPAVT